MRLFQPWLTTIYNIARASTTLTVIFQKFNSFLQPWFESESVIGTEAQLQFRKGARSNIIDVVNTLASINYGLNKWNHDFEFVECCKLGIRDDRSFRKTSLIRQLYREAIIEEKMTERVKYEGGKFLPHYPRETIRSLLFPRSAIDWIFFLDAWGWQ